jgi:NAD(P)H-dependent FMN reductase
MQLLILAGSLSDTSQSYQMARHAADHLEAKEDIDTRFVDLREYDLQFCDGRAWDEYNDDVTELQDAFRSADGYLFSVPVYNWSYSGAFKNTIDLIPPGGMNGEVAGLMAKGGASRGFLMLQREMRSLMAYFGVQTIPKTAYATNDDFSNGSMESTKVKQLIEDVADQVADTTGQLMDEPTGQR